MAFWIYAGLTALICLAAMARAMATRRETGDDPVAADLQVYRDQLKAVERDVARGVLNADEAERVRVEVSRRILEADKARGAVAEAAPRGATMAVIVLAAAVVLGGSLGLYALIGAPNYPDQPIADRLAAADALRANRPSQAEMEAEAPARPPIEPDAEFKALIEQLRTAVKERPDEVQGFVLLARHEAQLGNLAAAHAAQARVIALKGDAADGRDYITFAALLIEAAGGQVSDIADMALAETLSREPGNKLARYYVGLMHLQTRRPDQTFKFWEPLLREGPPDAPWIGPIRQRIEAVAQLAGVDYVLPATTPLPGPSAEDIEAAGEMSAEDRNAMIEGMVAQLGERLAAEGGPPEDWARFIQALGVLGRTEQAAAVWAEAQGFFADHPGLETIRAAAEAAGVAE